MVDQALFRVQVFCPLLQESFFETWWTSHMCFQSTIGDYVAENGLRATWVRAGVIGPLAWLMADKIMVGKSCKAGMSVHKLNYQADSHSSDACFLSDTIY